MRRSYAPWTTNPPDFFSKTTRQLTLMTFTMYIGGRPKNQWTMPELERLLRACTGITELSVCGCLSDPPILGLMEHLRPTRLNLAVLDLVSAFSVPNSNFAHPLFQRVSHLLLCDIEEVATPVWHHWTALSRLPALTHLAVIRGDLVPTILATLPRLQVLVLFSEKLEVEAAHSWDRRVVVVVADYQSFWDNWHEGVGLWMRADAFLDQKRRGDVPESCYQLPAC
ncbi:hypothetical protein MSAN_02006900 [Mycena sanguinolenta]|uniref:Uncharacterized protein n=1 Tax=Mycena sanguinolenta TaxID=230812 RepID=A0A8H6XMB8_9AGAR|nr:hypothetical protein MSAN_02006900 [Mycena sanguinolenta]